MITEQDFKLLKQVGKRAEKIQGKPIKDFLSLSYGFVKFDCLEYLKENNINALYESICKEHGIINILPYTERDVMRVLLYVIDGLELVNNLEQQNWSKELTAEQSNAGIEIFDKFENFNLLYSLCDGDLTKQEKWLSLRYDEVHSLVWYKRDKDIYNEQYSNLIKNKNK